MTSTLTGSGAAPCRRRRFRRCEVVAVGVSTGGPRALAVLVPGLPRHLPVLVVQHMPRDYTRSLAERLDRVTSLEVVEAEDGMEAAAGRVYIAPGGRHMRVRRESERVCIALGDDPPVNFCRPAVDSLFESVATVYADRSLAVVLTGMGRDGLGGCRRIRAAGGRVLVQDEASSVVWGMPGQVVSEGLADEVVALEEMAQAITRRSLAARGD